MQPPADLMDSVIDEIATTDRRSRAFLRFAPIAAAVLALAVVGGAVWALAPGGPLDRGTGVAPGGSPDGSASPPPASIAPSPDVDALPSAGTIEHEVSIGLQFPLRAIGHGSLWMYEWERGQVIRFDPQTGEAQAVIETGAPSGYDHRDAAIAITDEVVYAGAAGNRIVAIDPETNEVSEFAAELRASSLAIADGALWATDYHNDQVAWFDLESGGELGRVGVPGKPSALVVDGDTAWVAGAEGTLSRIDIPTKRRVATHDIAPLATDLVMRDGSLYISGEFRRAERFDPEQGAVVAHGGMLDHVLVVDGRIVGTDRNGYVAVLDPETLAWTAALEIGSFSRAATIVDGDALWIDALRDERAAMRIRLSD